MFPKSGQLMFSLQGVDHQGALALNFTRHRITRLTRSQFQWMTTSLQSKLDEICILIYNYSSLDNSIVNIIVDKTTIQPVPYGNKYTKRTIGSKSGTLQNQETN